MRSLQIHVRIAKSLIILSKNVYSWLRSGGIYMLEIQTLCRIPILTPTGIFKISLIRWGNKILLLWQGEVLRLEKTKKHRRNNHGYDQQYKRKYHSTSKMKMIFFGKACHIECNKVLHNLGNRKIWRSYYRPKVFNSNLPKIWLLTMEIKEVNLKRWPQHYL